MTISQINGSENTTNYNRLYKSPIFIFKNTSTIATSGFYLFDYHRDNLTTEKYGSFNNIVISNMSSSPITIYPNQDRAQGIIVVNGTDKVFSEESIGSTASLLIENSGSASITANQVSISIWKNRQELDSVFERVHKKFTNNEKKPSLLDSLKSIISTGKKGGSI